MPITSTIQYVKAQLDGLAMPGGIPNMAAYITPPDPNVEAEIPTCYIWPTKGREARESGRGGTIPRNTGPQTPSGTKPITHMIDLFVVYFGADDDPQADSLFPGVIDAVLEATSAVIEVISLATVALIVAWVTNCACVAAQLASSCENT